MRIDGGGRVQPTVGGATPGQEGLGCIRKGAELGRRSRLVTEFLLGLCLSVCLDFPS